MRFKGNRVIQKGRSKKVKKVLVLAIAGLMAVLLLMAGCGPELTDIDGYPLPSTPISVYEGKTLIEIPMEEVGEPNVCRTMSFRATQLAITDLWGEEIPQRSDFSIITACPTPESQNCLDYITKAKTGEGREGDFTIVLPEGTSLENLTGENYTFTFIRKSTGDKVEISYRGKGYYQKVEALPEEFFESRTKAMFDPAATSEEKRAFEEAEKEALRQIMELPMRRLFNFKLVRLLD